MLAALFSLFIATTPARAVEKTACILNASEEIFRLMKVYEPQIAKDESRSLQVSVKEIKAEATPQETAWASCGYDRDARDEGPLTKQYVIKMDRNCRPRRGHEEVRPTSNCPKNFSE